MQDIPRNELLDKLAAGWKVRRKSWDSNATISKAGGAYATPWWALLEDDWEGEPPEPVQSYKNVDIVTAFRHLQGGAAFIRRSSWADGRRTCLMATRFEVQLDELLATDWEVWG